MVRVHKYSWICLLKKKRKSEKKIKMKQFLEKFPLIIEKKTLVHLFSCPPSPFGNCWWIFNGWKLYSPSKLGNIRFLGILCVFSDYLSFIEGVCQTSTDSLFSMKLNELKIQGTHETAGGMVNHINLIWALFLLPTWRLSLMFYNICKCVVSLFFLSLSELGNIK